MKYMDSWDQIKQYHDYMLVFFPSHAHFFLPNSLIPLFFFFLKMFYTKHQKPLIYQFSPSLLSVLGHYQRSLLLLHFLRKTLNFPVTLTCSGCIIKEVWRVYFWQPLSITLTRTAWLYTSMQFTVHRESLNNSQRYPAKAERGNVRITL